MRIIRSLTCCNLQYKPLLLPYFLPRGIDESTHQMTDNCWKNITNFTWQAPMFAFNIERAFAHSSCRPVSGCTTSSDSSSFISGADASFELSSARPVSGSRSFSGEFEGGRFGNLLSADLYFARACSHSCALKCSVPSFFSSSASSRHFYRAIYWFRSAYIHIIHFA